ncbi:GIY-YIG nuclease family protein [Streptococcus iniae]
MKNNNQSQIVFENHQFKSDDFNSISSIYINNYPVLYILHNYKNKAYIGQTTNIRSRMKQHLKINERKVFSHLTLSQVFRVTNVEF